MTSKTTIGGGCFWCIESVFKKIKGIQSTSVGYAGGTSQNPSYEEVCSEDTGHAEVVELTYDDNKITYEEILDIFFYIHNPETKNKEGPDVGSQYRSIILYHNEDQKRVAEEKILDLERSDEYDKIVTEVVPLQEFFVAEEKHQDFYKKNPNSPYCQIQIPPKISKLESQYSRFTQ